ncbi:eukaryotic translation initiation factor 2B beta subunit, partial [Rhodotorula sp. JG-1b]
LESRQLIGSRQVALEVVRLLRDVVAGAKFSSFQQLVDHLEEVGRLLQEAGPKELVVTNMTRRICMLIREEYQTALSNHLDDTDNTGGSGGAGPSSFPNSPSDFAYDDNAANTPEEDDFSRRSFSLKPVFIEAIAELMDEVETTYRSVGEQAIEHIHSGEFIMTIGHSKTVEAFLKNAARKRKFTVICAETAPSFSGQKAAMAYSSAGIATILIPDSNIFALLPRCSKVLLGPHVILADGALLSIAGSLPLCLAANRMRVPVVAVGGMFKFSPVYLGEAADWGMRDLGSPEEVLPSTEECEQEETEILNPYYDVVPADLVSLYISNLGGHPSSLLYRLLNDMYGSS